MKAKKAKLGMKDIEARVERGEDVSEFFDLKNAKMAPGRGKSIRRGKTAEVQKVNVDFAVDMLAELDRVAAELNISRQAVIKMYLRLELDRHHLAMQAKKRA